MTYIEDQAALARERGQGRHSPTTQRQATEAEDGAAMADRDFPGGVKLSDALIGCHPCFRAAYDTRVCFLREANIRAGRGAHEWVHPGVTDLEITQLVADAAQARNYLLAERARQALEGNTDARDTVTTVILDARRARPDRLGGRS